jgi:hypothetical protein
MPNTARVVPNQLITDERGFARGTVRGGSYALRILRLGFIIMADTIVVRPGFADTLIVGLGTSTICFS